MRLLIPLILVCLLVYGCRKNNPVAGNTVEIYLLKSYDLVPGRCSVNSASVVLQDTALIKNSDILQYSPSRREYRFTANAASKLNLLSPRTAFAVTVDREIIFTGINMPPYMSSSCEHSIILTYGSDYPSTFQLWLGYPGASNTQIDDQRNNPRLIAAFERQRKLN